MKKIRFAIGQTNPIVGDYPANLAQIEHWVREAERKQVDFLVFPEMSLPGYPAWDLANKPSFIQAGLKHLNALVKMTRKLHLTVIVGYIETPVLGEDRSRNALAVISRGKIVKKYIKQLLPTYDVFLEDIFFAPGKQSESFPWKGMKIGLSICEDIWDDRYPKKPLQDLSKQGADLVINISASPFYSGVAAVRERLVAGHVKKYGFPILYVNQVGAQDDLIFDGRSFFADPKGDVLFRAPAFQQGLFFFDWNPANPPHGTPLPPTSNAVEEIYEALRLGVRDYCFKNGFKKVVIGLSGGIDSALVATLAADALGPDAVLGVTMPSQYSSEGSWKDSLDLAKRLGIQCLTRPIRKKYDFFLEEQHKNKMKEGHGGASQKMTLAMENLQARLRGLELMYLSNDEGRLLLTTGNKSELAMGYCTLYGDMAGGLAVIGDVYKTDVYRLAQYRNQKKAVIPEVILKKAPSAELRPNQKDQDSLPPYGILDDILKLYIEKNRTYEEIVKILKSGSKIKKFEALVGKVMNVVDHNEYKRRQTPPILRVTRKAWFGRRMPITNHFKQPC